MRAAPQNYTLHQGRCGGPWCFGTRRAKRASCSLSMEFTSRNAHSLLRIAKGCAGRRGYTDAMDGKPLDAQRAPFRLIAIEHKRRAPSVHSLVSIEVKTAG